MHTNGGRRRLLSKEEADQVFAMTRIKWNSKAVQFIAPGWELRLYKHITGTQVIGYEPATGFGFSLQPLFANDTDPPTMLTIGNYFKSGQLPPMTEQLRKDTEAFAQDALGPTYSVRLNSTIMGTVDVIEFLVSRS